jgi:hypothetical protein
LAVEARRAVEDERHGAGGARGERQEREEKERADHDAVPGDAAIVLAKHG